MAVFVFSILISMLVPHFLTNGVSQLKSFINVCEIAFFMFVQLTFSTIIKNRWFSDELKKLFLFKYVLVIYNYNSINIEKQPQLVN